MTDSLTLAFVVGVAFGWALEQAGLGYAPKLAAQFYLRDFAVFKVMFSAVVTAMLGAFWLGRLGVIDLGAVYVPETFLYPQLAGGLVFGLGFVACGLCPGTSCVSAATGRADGLAVIAGLLAGVVATGFAVPAIEPFFSSGSFGAFTLPQALSLPYGVVVLLVVALAIGGFLAAERLERRA
jgi:uncharacterized membrane protein YedE/YeeE